MRALFLGFVLTFTMAAITQAEPTSPKFEKKKIQFAGKTISVEVADNDLLRSHGLMFRKSLPAEEGMLFIFDNEQPLAFWMKNTLIPLSIGYFDKQKKLIDIHEMVPAVMMATDPVLYPSKEAGMYALEMNKGWFAKNKIKLGTTFRFDDASTKAATKTSTK
jgi:uncharacterized membrane protein (UPF0127 family)